MSKSSAQTSSKTILKNEPHRKSPATGVATAAATTTRITTTRVSKPKLKQQDSGESERSLRKTTTIATTTSKRSTPTLTPTPPSSLHTSKNKERDPVPSKRATPSPTTKAGTTKTLRAKPQQQQQVQSLANINKASKTSKPSKPNAVLDTYHSVTVSSPPSKRKVQPKQTTITEHEEELPGTRQEQQQRQRARAYSRTLQPEEIVVLKRESAKQRSELQVQQQQNQLQKEIKQPVAFEVNFEAAKKQTNESDNYSDDFESYESDFETDASTPEEEEEDEDEQEEDQEKPDECEESPEPAPAPAPAPTVQEHDENDDDDDEDSEPTQNPITVIQRDKEVEGKLDSGHFEMNSRRQPRPSLDSFDTNSMANSEQLDSGISSYGVSAPIELHHPPNPHRSTADVHFGGYVDFVRHPVITRRGLELMRKLRFDQLEYQLFDMKPLSYEGYMQSYGKLNTCQLATQTHSQHMDTECQTLEVHTRSSWTQHPPHYGAGQLVLSCSGDAGNDAETILLQTNNDTLESSLARLEQLRRTKQQRALEQQRQRLSKPDDMERLGLFLQRASLFLGKALNANRPQHASLQTGFLDALRVRRIFGSAGQQQLVVTVHECPPQSDVYRDEFANLLMVWSLTDPSKPLRLLSTWAEVCRVAFSSEAPDIIVAGLRDGSVAMWDLRETHSYCSKLDGKLTHFAATQSVVPTLQQQQQQAGGSLDLGAVVDVRSFRPANKMPGMGLSSTLAVQHKDLQYVSLNDSGLLTIWTLVKNERGFNAGGTNEYSSPWARVKLLQAASCDLRDYLERRLLKRNQSAYDKTKSLFQGNVYSDELLRELNETQTLANAFADQGLQGLRFSSIDAGSELIYVCTNRNFVLCCTRSLKTERFTRIGLHESRFLFPTALCVLANEYFVAVGLSNGSVMILNCNQRQRQRLQRPITAMPTARTNIEPEPETGKSCAIQNIILNERRSFEEQELERRPNTALQLLQQPRRAYEQRIFDQQLLLSGSALRKHLVQAIVQSSDGWKLFALSNGSVRAYDFHLDREIQLDPSLEVGPSSSVTDIATASSSTSSQQLLSLDKDGQVQMHFINL